MGLLISALIVGKQMEMPFPGSQRVVLEGGVAFPIATANDGGGRIIECVARRASGHCPPPRSQSREEMWMMSMSGERERGRE
jgi:hypothetical protein